MPRGPLPKPPNQRHRKGKAAYPTTDLPVTGRTGPAPECPYELGPAGSRWWAHSWSTPSACGWSETGDLFVVARRARLEDWFDEDAPLGIAKEMRELDDRLGLTPKGLAGLRWRIVAAAGQPVLKEGGHDEIAAKRRRRVKPVDDG